MFQDVHRCAKTPVLLAEVKTCSSRTASKYDIALVQRLLQHSSAAVTQRYIGIEPQRIEKAIEGHAELI